MVNIISELANGLPKFRLIREKSVERSDIYGRTQSNIFDSLIHNQIIMAVYVMSWSVEKRVEIWTYRSSHRPTRWILHEMPICQVLQDYQGLISS